MTGMGTITPEGETVVVQGDELKYVARPNPGYKVSGVQVDGSPLRFRVAPNGNFYYKFRDVQSGHRIRVTFSRG